MKVELPDFDKSALLRLLQADYALDAVRLEFVPKGEESHSYIATTRAGKRHFVKVHVASASPALEACYRFVHYLCMHEHCAWMVSPHLTTTGACVARHEERAVAVFDEVIGVTQSPGDLTEQQIAQFAGQLATLHRAVVPARQFGLPIENFGISFKAWLLEVLDAVEQPLQASHAWAQAAYELIRREKPHILDVLAQAEASGPLLHAADLPLAVTHGDLASHNIIQDKQGSLLVIDWGKLCIAPPARDLVGLWEDGNPAMLAAYFRNLDAPPAQLQQTLSYYFQYYLLAIVTDYGSWLLLEDASPEEAANAWQGLQQVLPVDLLKLHATVAAICTIAAHTNEKDAQNDQPYAT